MPLADRRCFNCEEIGHQSGDCPRTQVSNRCGNCPWAVEQTYRCRRCAVGRENEDMPIWVAVANRRPWMCLRNGVILVKPIESRKIQAWVNDERFNNVCVYPPDLVFNHSLVQRGMPSTHHAQSIKQCGCVWRQTLETPLTMAVSVATNTEPVEELVTLPPAVGELVPVDEGGPSNVKTTDELLMLPLTQITTPVLEPKPMMVSVGTETGTWYRRVPSDENWAALTNPDNIMDWYRLVGTAMQFLDEGTWKIPLVNGGCLRIKYEAPEVEPPTPFEYPGDFKDRHQLPPPPK